MLENFSHIPSFASCQTTSDRFVLKKLVSQGKKLYLCEIAT